jgi:hypothetical protein
MFDKKKMAHPSRNLPKEHQQNRDVEADRFRQTFLSLNEEYLTFHY